MEYLVCTKQYLVINVTYLNKNKQNYLKFKLDLIVLKKIKIINLYTILSYPILL
jgi:hypothetical protein